MHSSKNFSDYDQNILSALSRKKFLITGANGMLGRAFRAQLEPYVSLEQLYCFDIIELDVRLPGAFVRYANLRPDYIVHCAGIIDADYCETQVEEGKQSIVDGTFNVVEFARSCNAKLLYPQSFLIYDGAELIDEQTIPNPLCNYGRFKLDAEKLVLARAPMALSVRMGGFFGGESADNNFVGRITRHLSQLIRQGSSIIDIGNRVWQPTYTNDLAKNCLLLLASERTGTYCMASHESASFYELACEISVQLGITDKVKINAIDSAVLAAKEKAVRPLSAIMINRRLEVEGLDRQRPWRQALAEYLNHPYFKDLINE
jgi:dTDP-4-dehydrorhamnose reductase